MHFFGVYLTSKCPQKGKKTEAFDNSGLRGRNYSSSIVALWLLRYIVASFIITLLYIYRLYVLSPFLNHFVVKMTPSQ